MELNDDWIYKFEETDKLYQHFYKEDIYHITIKYIYINRESCIEKIIQQPFLMSTPNYISREELLYIIKNSTIENTKRYSLLAILKYNITLDPEDIKNFIIYQESNQYLHIVKNVDSITFDKSISMFQDLNELMFIYYEKVRELKHNELSNSTKKVYLYTPNKKTLKNRYKD